MGERLGVDEHVIEKWESLFFDVRESREAVDWIFIHIIGPERERGNDQLASKMKAALAGGPVAARAILDLESRMPVTAGEKLFDRKLALSLKLDAALQVRLDTSREKISFIRLCDQLRLRERRLKLAERKFEMRCAEARDKQQRAEIRRELAEQRAAQRAERDRKKELARVAAQKARAFVIAQEEAQLQAEWEAAAARAAACPLSALTWGPTGDSKVSSSKTDACDERADAAFVDETATQAPNDEDMGVSASNEGCWSELVKTESRGGHVAELAPV
jgi:hypothetical protein